MDKATRVFYDLPLDVARAPEVGVDKPPFVKILARPVERMRLLKALSDSGRLAPLPAVPLSIADWGAGLFCVAKDAQRDRLVLDARPANLLESFPGRWVHSLASATALAGIILEPNELLRMSGTGLRDCFYQFVVASPQRTQRNHLQCKLSLVEARAVFGYSCDHLVQPGGFAACGLSSLARGDSTACEFAQCAHLGVLLHGRAVYPGELLVQAAPPRRSLLTAGLVIDDLVLLQRCLAQPLDGSSLGPSLGAERLRAALDAYKSAPLEFNEKKTFVDSLQAFFWGVDCCGRTGLVRALPARYWPLVLITLRVVQLGLASRALLESLLG